MQPLVQSAIDAANQGNKSKAIELLKQILNTNPKDIEALVTLATLVDEPTRRRQVLNRILSLDATNKAARAMLLELDRAELNSYRSQASSPSAAVAQSPSALPSSPQVPAPGKSSSLSTEKPMVFRYSTGWLVVLYLFTTFFCCIGLLVASQNIANSLPSLALAFLFGISALSLSSKVEVKEAGIRTSSLLRKAEIKWNDIASIKSSTTKQKLELISTRGESVKVSTQVKGYAVIVELLRQKRPDLFGETASSSPRENLSASRNDQLSPASYGSSVPAFALTGTKTFHKSFFKQYSMIFVGIFFCLFLVLLLFSMDVNWDFFTIVGVLLSVIFGALLIIGPFFQVSAIKVEPNKLTIQTFFEEKEFSARQIKEIKMQSVRGRYGRVTNFVNIIPVEGKKYPVGGFADGEEIIYGFLMNWWNAYQNK